MRSLERDEKREKEQLEKKNHKKHKSNFSRTRSQQERTLFKEEDKEEGEDKEQY